MGVKFRRLRGPIRFPAAYVKVTVAGNVFKVVSMRDPPGVLPIRRISDRLYVNLLTGQYGEYHVSETKADLVQGVRRSMARLSLIISANCLDSRYLRWMTLTYRENMQDYKRLYRDFKRFWVAFARYCKRMGFPVPEYIVVAEPQGRGAWHLHVILIFPCVAPFIPNDVVQSLWGQGFTKLKGVHGVDNLAAYFSAYLSDMPLEDASSAGVDLSACTVLEKSVVDDSEVCSRKKFVKGARLAFYPAGMNFYRCSRGISRPRSAVLRPEEWEVLKEKVGLAEPTFSRSSVVFDDSSGGCSEVNAVNVDYYTASSS